MKTEKPGIDESPSDKTYWLDNSKNVNLVFYGLVVLCAALLLADLFYHKHVHFEFENWFGFFALFGFGVYVALVVSAKALRLLISRQEDYYDQ